MSREQAIQHKEQDIMEENTQPNEGISRKDVLTGLGGFVSSGVGLGQQHGFLSDNLHKVRTHKATISFRPLEAFLDKDKKVVGHLNPYCKFKIGWGRGKSEVAMAQSPPEELKDIQGTKYVWGDTITLKRSNKNEATIIIKDKDRPAFSNRLGKAKISLDKVIQEGIVDTWIPIELNGQITGELRVQIEYQPPLAH